MSAGALLYRDVPAHPAGFRRVDLVERRAVSMMAKGEGSGSSVRSVSDRLSATLALDESVGRVRLVSPVRAKALEKLGIRTVRDLVTHYPRRYIDLSCVRRVGDAAIGETCTIRGVVHEVKLKRPRPSLTLVEISPCRRDGPVDDHGVSPALAEG